MYSRTRSRLRTLEWDYVANYFIFLSNRNIILWCWTKISILMIGQHYKWNWYRKAFKLQLSEYQRLVGFITRIYMLVPLFYFYYLICGSFRASLFDINIMCFICTLTHLCNRDCGCKMRVIDGWHFKREWKGLMG